MSHWTDIIERSGDENVGAALVRLARMAAAVHMDEASTRVKERKESDGSLSRPTAADATARRAVHTEVNR